MEKKLLSGINKAIAKGNADLKKPKAKKPATKKKGPKVEKLKVYQKSKVLNKILTENPDMVLGVQDLRAEKKGYRVDFQPCYQFATDSKDPQHFVSDEGLTDLLISMKDVGPCYCSKCQATIKWSRPKAYTKETKLRCKTDGGYIIMTPKQWDDRPFEWVKVGEINYHSSLRWMDHNKEDAVKINKLLGDEVFQINA